MSTRRLRWGWGHSIPPSARGSLAGAGAAGVAAAAQEMLLKLVALRDDVHEKAAKRTQYIARHAGAPVPDVTAPPGAMPRRSAARATVRASLVGTKIAPDALVYVADVLPTPVGLNSWAAAPETAAFDALVSAKAYDNKFIQACPRAPTIAVLIVTAPPPPSQAEMYHPSPLDISHVALPNWLADLALAIAAQVRRAARSLTWRWPSRRAALARAMLCVCVWGGGG